MDSLIVEIMAEVYASPIAAKEVQSLVAKLPAAIHAERARLRSHAGQQASPATVTPSSAVVGAENVRLKAELEQLGAANADLNVALNEAKAEVDDCRAEIWDLHSKLDEARPPAPARGEATLKMTDLQMSNANQRHELSNLNKIVGKLRPENERLKRQVQRQNKAPGGPRHQFHHPMVKVEDRSHEFAHSTNTTGTYRILRISLTQGGADIA